MIFEFVSSTWSKVELKTHFQTWIGRNDVNGVSLFHLSYLITLMFYQCSKRAPIVQTKYFMFDWSIYRLFVIDWVWKSDSLQIMIFVNVCSTWDIVQLRTRFETWITWNDVNAVSLFHSSYLIRLLPYLYSQRTPNVQIKYFIFDWSIYRLIVIHRGWKRDSLQILKFVYVCSTWGIVELKRRLEILITRNVVNGVCVFTFLILQHLWLTRSHKGHQMSKSSILCLNSRFTDYLC
jgi:hypothetical protein